MGSPVAGTSPSYRMMLASILAIWGDLDYQQRAWVRGEFPDRPYDLLWFDVDEMYDGLDVLPDPQDSFGDTAGTSAEVDRLQLLSDVIDPIVAHADVSWSDYSTWLRQPGWPDVVRLSRDSLILLVLNGGSLSVNLIGNSPLVADPVSRALVTRALASLLENARPVDLPGHQDPPPPYLITVDAAIDVLRSRGHLDDPAAAIGTIYVDDDEIPRLQALNSALRDDATDFLQLAGDALVAIIRADNGWQYNPEELVT